MEISNSKPDRNDDRLSGNEVCDNWEAKTSWRYLPTPVWYWFASAGKEAVTTEPANASEPDAKN